MSVILLVTGFIHCLITIELLIFVKVSFITSFMMIRWITIPIVISFIAVSGNFMTMPMILSLIMITLLTFFIPSSTLLQCQDPLIMIQKYHLHLFSLSFFIIIASFSLPLHRYLLHSIRIVKAILDFLYFLTFILFLTLYEVSSYSLCLR